MAKEEIMAVRMTTEQREKINEEARKQNLTGPAYVLQALDFYASFDVHFLEQINITAEKMQLPLTTVIQNLLLAYIAADSAMLETYKTPPKTFKRAFQFSDQMTLITGTDLSHLVFDQTKTDAEALKKKLDNSVRTGKPARITTEEGVFLATHAAAR